jgi:outer membrane protein OmpA-like peptidoglycan-associated protein
VFLAAIVSYAQETTFKEVRQLADQAVTSRAELLSPRHFQEASQAWAEAQADSARKPSAERTNLKLVHAQQYFGQAIENARQVAVEFGEALAAYDSAQINKASESAPKSWEKGAALFSKMINLNEAGNVSQARQEFNATLMSLRQAELEAIQANLLGPARGTLEQAAKHKAEALAPISYKIAVSTIKQTEDSIAADRYNTNANKRLASEAAYSARHALYLAQRITELKKKEDWENPILEFEGTVNEFSQALELRAQFDQGLDPPVETLRTKLRILLEDRNRLQTRTVRQDSIIGLLEAETAKLSSQSGQYASELDSKRQELDRKKRFEDKFSRISALFKPGEGAVLQQGDRVVIRLMGLQFSSGKVELKKVNADLMNRVQQALAEFPERNIEVQGHTDSQGEEGANLELSQKRAQAVVNYLIEKMNIPDSRISALGLGETVPLVSNETAAGRAINRRIEIVLKP